MIWEGAVSGGKSYVFMVTLSSGTIDVVPVTGEASVTMSVAPISSPHLDLVCQRQVQSTTVSSWGDYFFLIQIEKRSKCHRCDHQIELPLINPGTCGGCHDGYVFVSSTGPGNSKCVDSIQVGATPSEATAPSHRNVCLDYVTLIGQSISRQVVSFI